MTGMQGVLRNTSGVVLVFISTLIDVKDSNEANIWATIEALKIFNTSIFGPAKWEVIPSSLFFRSLKKEGSLEVSLHSKGD